jgi:Ca2+-binding EF-hand superfamily protein
MSRLRIINKKPKTRTLHIHMKSITSILAILALGSSFAVAADAAAGADKPKRDPAVAFKKLDTNNDSKLSAEEWAASPAAKKDAAKATEMFGRKDKDGDKSLTLEEFSAGGKKKDK